MTVRTNNNPFNTKRLVKWYTIFFVLILIIGTVLRTYKIGTIPVGFHGDEAWTGLEARRILNEGFIGFWSEAALGQATIPAYWTSLFFILFGESISSARISFALLSSLSIIYIFLTIRLLFSTPSALLTILLISTGTIPLTLSRRADYVSVYLSFFPGLYYFILALRSGRYVHWGLAGFFIGLSHHMYASLWITPVLFIIFLTYHLIQNGITFIKINYRGLLIMGLIYLILASPLLIKASFDSNTFFSRANMLSIFSENGINHARSYLSSDATSIDILLNNLKATMGMFTTIPDIYTWNNFATTPVFDFISSVLFIFGLLVTIKKIFKKNYFYMYSTFLFFLSGSILTVDAPSFRRSQISIYIAYFFIASAIIFIFRFLLKFPPYVRNSLIIFGISIIGYICIFNVYQYFNHAGSDVVKHINAYSLVESANYINKIPYSKKVYFYSSNWSYNYETMKFLIKNTSGEDRSSEFGTYSLNLDKISEPAVYILFPPYSDHLDELKSLYPNGVAEDYIDQNNNKLLFSTYLIPSIVN